MKKMTTWVAGLALPLLAMASTASSAATLDIKFSHEDADVKALSTSFSDDYNTGRLAYLDRSGNSFYAYCVELQQEFAPANLGFQTYQISSFNAPQATALQGLFSSSYAGLSNSMQQAAFQTAVWEITHETMAGPLSVTPNSGSFYFSGLTDVTPANAAASNAQFEQQVNGYLNAAASYQGASLYTITRLSNGNFQDLVLATAVPEPASTTLLLAGLIGMASVARRRMAV